MSEYSGVLVYDPDDTFLPAAAVAFKRLEDLGAVPRSADAARAFLRAQFDEAPAAVVFVDRGEGRVYAGRDAARVLAERAEMTGLVSAVEFAPDADPHPALDDLSPDLDVFEGTFPLTERARARYDDLAARAGRPSELRDPQE